ncbi:MAG TPA: isoprenylcysteine carboxylmethyltransferase family protein [Roseiflexaceae bacterium]|nr:isoprenylcysteine carboxylmethyltransferase family protein [Roseiflexaceae bacterium]
MANRSAADAAHTRWWQTFEAVFGIPFLAAVALQLIVPLSLPRGPLTPAVIPAGALLIVAGLALVIRARREFARQRQPTDPGHPTSQLVTEDVFAFSRNPLYLGGVCMLAGIALVLDLPWVFALLLPALVACHYLLVVPEETYLAAKFGDQYHAYAATVHRWLGRRRGPR